VRMGVASVEVEVSASVSFEIVKGVSEMGDVIDTVIDRDSWITPSSVVSVDTSAICSSCIKSCQVCDKRKLKVKLRTSE
jgi:hypothetical protein